VQVFTWLNTFILSNSNWALNNLKYFDVLNNQTLHNIFYEDIVLQYFSISAKRKKSNSAMDFTNLKSTYAFYNTRCNRLSEGVAHWTKLIIVKGASDVVCSRCVCDKPSAKMNPWPVDIR